MPSKREDFRLTVTEVEVTRTNIPSLDYVLGRGGLPRGRTVVFFGPESSGKTLLSLQCLASFQRAGKKGAFVDLEAALDGTIAKACRVDTDALEYYVPSDGDQLIEILEDLAGDSSVGLIVIDSITAAKVIESASEWSIGMLSRFASRLLPSIASPLYRSGNTLLLISQVRNVIGYATHAEPTGGFAVRHYPSIIVQLKPSRRDNVMFDRRLSAYKLTLTCTKNKCARPGRSADTWIHLDYPVGVRTNEDLVRMSMAIGLISPHSKTYEGVKLAERKEQIRAMVQTLKEHGLLTKLYEEYYSLIDGSLKEVHHAGVSSDTSLDARTNTGATEQRS